MRGPMKLVDGRTGLIECRACGRTHFANLRPGYLGGGYYRGSWQCSNAKCPSNQKVWDAEAARWVRVDWRKRIPTAGFVEGGVA
jgi:hypothetical protein